MEHKSGENVSHPDTRRGVLSGRKPLKMGGIQLVELAGKMTIKPRRTVLIVEDALTIRNMLEDFFTMYGYDVLMASDPDTAFKRLKDSHAVLDAMVLDIALDDNRSGLEVLELMRLDDRFVDLTVVVLTGLPNLDERDVEVINRNGAHLLYKQEGYERVFNKLDVIIKPLRKGAPQEVPDLAH
jgi:DNA-binding response OmpR family regulator